MNPFIAGLLSLIIPGLGQLYRGSLIVGIIWFVATAIGYTLFVIPGIILHVLCVIFAFTGSPKR